MANTKSAEKRARQNEQRAARNRVWRSSARTAIKRARLAIQAGDPNADELVRSATRALDRAATKGAIHKNNAARRQSRLTKLLNKATAAA
ncbi:MAG: 30S ribosomal protein S20 [Caldilineaceae bacterium]|nr:30S ribosomal protein S20 [Caldilineaceae bacterium]